MGGPPPGDKGGKGGKGGPPPGGGKDGVGKGKSKDDIQAAQKAKREAEKAAMEARKAAELAHVRLLDEVPSRSAADITNVDWSSVKTQILLAGGTSIIELADGTLICLRRCPNPASEYLADRVAAVLKVRTPQSRLVQPDDEEYTAISDMTDRMPAWLLDMPMTFESFVSELKDATGGFIATEQKLPLVEKLEFSDPKRSTALLDCTEKANGTIVVMEFLPGKGLDQLCGSFQEEELRAMGVIGALDALLNKDDCIALPVWRESGNLTNIMRSEGVVAIDSHVHATDDTQAYVTGLNTFAQQLTKLEGSGDSISAQQVAEQNLEQFKKGGFDVTDADMSVLVEGIKIGLQQIANSWTAGELNKVLGEAEAVASTAVPWQADAPTAGACASFVRLTAAAIAGNRGAGGEAGEVATADSPPLEEAGGNGPQWEMLGSDNTWTEAPFKSPASVVVGKRLKFNFQGIFGELAFTSETTGNITCKGKEYAVRLKA